MEVILYYFFFSSRRRHTRCGRDWSSDVCSSDLLAVLAVEGDPLRLRGVVAPAGGDAAEDRRGGAAPGLRRQGRGRGGEPLGRRAGERRAQLRRRMALQEVGVG